MLPLGATEPHNLHLPYGTDTFQVEAIAERACAVAHGRGARVVLLPALPYGTETNQMRFPLAMNLNPSTVAPGDHRPRRLAGNARHPQVRPPERPRRQRPEMGAPRAAPDHAGPSVPVQLVQGGRRTSTQTIFEDAGDHAGEMETSMGLAHFPGLVAMDQADAGTMAADAVRGRQPGLGRDHPPLAPADDQLRRGRPAARHRRPRARHSPRSSSSGSPASSRSLPPAPSTRTSPIDPRTSRGRPGPAGQPPARPAADLRMLR